MVTSMYLFIYTYMPAQFPLPRSNLCPSCAHLDLRHLLKLFVKLASPDPHRPLPPNRKRHSYQRIYSYLVTLWGMVLQSLLADRSLDQVVVSFRHRKADALLRGKKPLSSKIKSRQTAAFSKARTRLPLEWIQNVFSQWPTLLGRKISDGSWKNWNVLLLDGSTIRLAPWENIRTVFKPHRGPYPSHWCLMRVVVGFCLRSGLAMGSALGPQSTSEQVLAGGLILAAQAKTLILGDRNFGIFRIVQTARHAQAQVLVRLTRARAFRLAKSELVPGLDLPVRWSPSRHDQLQPDSSKQAVPGRLIVCRIQRPGSRPFNLYLFTTLCHPQLYPAQELVNLYGLRWHVELNLRYLKTHLNLEFLNCKSAPMAQKEWFAGLIAYNLIRAMMFLAATKTLFDPLALSFCSSAREVLQALLQWASGKPVNWKEVLESIAKCGLPKRKKPRPNEPRLVRVLRRSFGPLRGSRAAARRKVTKKGLPKC